MRNNRPAPPARLPDRNAVRPKIGLAFSGGSGKAISYVGILEVFEENNIPIDYITACSSGTIIAASYACGTLQKLKDDWLSLDKKFVLKMFELNNTKQALFSTDKFAEWLGQYVNKNFEDVTPRLGFVCADLKTATQIVLGLGDILKAGQASCAVPGLFSTIPWGNMLLADGGLVCTIPGKEAREMGADIVIGGDILGRRHVFTRKTIQFREKYNNFKESSLFWPFRFLSKQFNKFRDAVLVEQRASHGPNIFSILGNAMNIVVDIEKNEIIDNGGCDVVLTPDVKLTNKIGFSDSKNMYEEGRRVALEAITQIRKLIAEHKA